MQNLYLFGFWAPKCQLFKSKIISRESIREALHSYENSRNTFMRDFWENLEHRIFPASLAQLRALRWYCTQIRHFTHIPAPLCGATVFAMWRNCVTNLPQSITWFCFLWCGVLLSMCVTYSLPGGRLSWMGMAFLIAEDFPTPTWSLFITRSSFEAVNDAKHRFDYCIIHK